jgi:hypothetical protein
MPSMATILVTGFERDDPSSLVPILATNHRVVQPSRTTSPMATRRCQRLPLVRRPAEADSLQIDGAVHLATVGADHDFEPVYRIDAIAQGIAFTPEISLR